MLFILSFTAVRYHYRRCVRIIGLVKCKKSFQISNKVLRQQCCLFYWTFFPPHKCYILDGCKETENPEAKSGERNCPPGITVHKLDIITTFSDSRARLVARFELSF